MNYEENIRKIAEEMAAAYWNEHKSNAALRYEQLATHIQEGAIKKMMQCARIAVRILISSPENHNHDTANQQHHRHS